MSFLDKQRSFAPGQLSEDNTLTEEDARRLLERLQADDPLTPEELAALVEFLAINNSNKDESPA